MEIIEEKVSQEFIEQYADEIFTRWKTIHQHQPLELIKGVCILEVDTMINHMQEHEDVIEFLNNVKQVIENKQE
jgi:hypothetical protein